MPLLYTIYRDNLLGGDVHKLSSDLERFVIKLMKLTNAHHIEIVDILGSTEFWLYSDKKLRGTYYGMGLNIIFNKNEWITEAFNGSFNEYVKHKNSYECLERIKESLQ